MSFHRSVIDWDESLYFLMAEAWRAGHLPYTTLWDNKPLGIYAIFATFQILFGDSVGSIRIAAVVAVSMTGFFLFRLAQGLVMVAGHRERLAASFLAGALYIVASIQDDGIAANTELFMAPFICAGMVLACSGRHSLVIPWASGLLFGLAFIVKYVALFEFPAGLLAIVLLSRNADGDHRPVLRSALFLLGIGLPFAFCLLLYAFAGHLDALMSASVASNLRRLDMPFSTSLAIKAFSDHATSLALLYLPLLALPIAAIGTASATDNAEPRRHPAPVAAVLALWVVGGFCGAASAKSFYAHYFLQPLPALCLASIWVVSRGGLFRQYRGLICAPLLLAQPLWNASGVIATTWVPVHLDQPGIGRLRDGPARVAADLGPALARGSAAPLYVFDYEPILYSLVGSPPPTPYAFPSFVISRFLSHVANIDPAAVLAKIAAQRPQFIVRYRFRQQNAARDNLQVYAALDALLKSRYELWKSYPDAAVYRLRGDP